MRIIPALWGSSTVGEQDGLKRKGFVDLVKKAEERRLHPLQGQNGGAGPEGEGTAETLRPAAGGRALGALPSRGAAIRAKAAGWPCKAPS